MNNLSLASTKVTSFLWHVETLGDSSKRQVIGTTLNLEDAKKESEVAALGLYA